MDFIFSEKYFIGVFLKSLPNENEPERLKTSSSANKD